MPDLGARFFGPCAASTGRIRSRLRLSPMNLTARHATTMAPSARIDRAASQTCRKPRKKTAKAESILASTGLSTRGKQLRWGGAWQTTFSNTPLHLEHDSFRWFLGTCFAQSVLYEAGSVRWFDRLCGGPRRLREHSNDRHGQTAKMNLP